MQRRCILSCSLSGLFIIFHVYFWLEPELGKAGRVFMSSHCLSIYLFILILPIPLFHWERKKLAPQSPCPAVGFREAGPCNCKSPVEKTKPLAAFLAKASRWAVIAEINERAAELRPAGGRRDERQQLKAAVGMSILIRIPVWDTDIAQTVGSSQPSGFLEPVKICSRITCFSFFQNVIFFPLIWAPFTPRKKTQTSKHHTVIARGEVKCLRLSLLFSSLTANEAWLNSFSPSSQLVPLGWC